jgi:phosphatidylinositol alpha-1,6-mannosyltransferase
VWCHGIEVWGPIDRTTLFALRRADQVFAPSRFTASEVERRAGLPAGSVTIVPHCLSPELDRVREASSAGRVPGRVVTVARLHPHHRYKGIDTLLDAWPSIIGSVPHATLMVVGDGPDRPRLERQAHDLGVSESVEFRGNLTDTDLAQTYSTSSLFVLPARHRTGVGAEGEGFGLVFVEAGAAGLPVVAGAGGGADDAVESGVSGLLVDPLDRGAIAAATARLLTEPDLASRLGAGGRRLATTRFSFEAFTNRIVGLIESMVAGSRVR